MKSILFLIGLRGAGKTTIGRLVAERLSWNFVDTDQWIQESTGRTIRDIFTADGEAAFRDLESAAIANVAVQEECVVSLGGGACERPVNRELIRQSGRAVWLTALPAVLWQRISRDSQTRDQRPALSDQGGEDELAWLLEQRSANYAACADFVCDTGQGTVEDAANIIAGWWHSADTKRV